MAHYLKWPFAAMERDPEVTYKEVIEFFQSFPKEDDPRGLDLL